MKLSEFGLDALKKRVVRPLTGIQIASDGAFEVMQPWQGTVLLRREFILALKGGKDKVHGDPL